MKDAVAADHAGFVLKGRVLEQVRSLGHEAVDLGTHSEAPPVDYPDSARAVGEAIAGGVAHRGVLLCGSGVGASVAANKLRGVRAAICHDTSSARQGVEHDDLNVLTLGARIIGSALVPDLVRAFLDATFSGEERHIRRLRTINQLEEEAMGAAVPCAGDSSFIRFRGETMSNPLMTLQELGQSPWHDNIHRDLITRGKLAQMIKDGDITGLTSSPTIFEKAIADSDAYDDALGRLVAEGRSAEAIFDALAIDDIQRAARLFMPVFERTKGNDGYVSIEVSPKLAHDTQETIAEAKRLWRTVDRPNLMVKIPATLGGLPAIEAAIADGININVTLIFSLERYDAVMSAYIGGLKKRVEAGGDIRSISSVASFFISRVDSAVDRLLDQKIVAGANNPEVLRALRGKTGIANAKLAYEAFLRRFGDDAFAPLAKRGGRRQRPLWASTSSKDPSYPDTYYVEALVGPDTVNTMPPATIVAYRDHGKPEVRINRELKAARSVIAGLGTAGVDLTAVLAQLEKDGVASFAKSYDSLLAVVAKRAAGGRRDTR